MNIYILTGDIRSGKTTRLLQWCNEQSSIGGIATPVVSDKRFFLDVATDDTCTMEAEPGEDNVLEIGRFVFSSSAFQWAENVLRNAVKENYNFIVIDEIGPLELQGKGFHDVLKEMLASEVKNLVLVVRQSKVEEVIAAYELKNAKVIYELNYLIQKM